MSNRTTEKFVSINLKYGKASSIMNILNTSMGIPQQMTPVHDQGGSGKQTFHAVADPDRSITFW